RLHVTIRGVTHEKLRRAQALMRRDLPSGDPAEILDQSLTLLLEWLEKRRIGAGRNRRPQHSSSGAVAPLPTETEPAAAGPASASGPAASADSFRDTPLTEPSSIRTGA